MLNLFYNIYNMKDYFNENNFKMYLFWWHWIYYYGFICLEKKEYTLNIEYSSEFRSNVSLIIEPWSYFPYKNKDNMFIVYNWKKIKSVLNRTYNRSIIDLDTKLMPINWLALFNMIKY